PVRAANSTPQIHDKLATVVDGHGGAAVGVRDLLPEDVRHLAELFIVTTCDQIRFRCASFHFRSSLLADVGNHRTHSATDPGANVLHQPPNVTLDCGRSFP